jgi:hypothetical protein
MRLREVLTEAIRNILMMIFSGLTGRDSLTIVHTTGLIEMMSVQGAITPIVITRGLTITSTGHGHPRLAAISQVATPDPQAASIGLVPEREVARRVHRGVAICVEAVVTDRLKF